MKGPAMENLTFECKARQWYSLNSFVYSNHLQTVISKGRKASPRFRQRASSPERPCVLRCQKQKVPRPYSVAEEGAPSLTGSRDDDLCDKDGHDSSKAIQTASLPRHASTQAVRQQISRLLPIIDFSKTQPAGLRLLFRPYLVIAQLSHEYFLVYGLPGVVEHR
jgi:hypothetical protein